MGKNGLIQIPSEFQQDTGMIEGSDVLLVENGEEILIRKNEKMLEDRMEDSAFWHAAQSDTVKEIWGNEPEGYWEQFLSEKGKQKLARLKKKGLE